MSKLTCVDGAVRFLGLDLRNLNFLVRWPHDGDISSCKGPMILCIAVISGSYPFVPLHVLFIQGKPSGAVAVVSLPHRQPRGNSANEAITSEHAHPSSPSSRMALSRDPRRGETSSGTSSVSRPPPVNCPGLRAQSVMEIPRIWADPGVWFDFDV